MPRVSVVLPNYNYERYLEERIRSILGQSYTDFEFVIIDDASTDASLEVIETFNDPRISVHVRPENSGKVYASWNEGLKHCSGDLVLFAGADDCAERTMLEKLVAPFDAHPGLGMSHCRFLNIDANGMIMSTLIALAPAAAFIVQDLQADYFSPRPLEWQRLLVTNFIWNASGVLMKRESIERAGGFDDSLLIAADWRLYLEIARDSDTAYAAEPLNAFRQLPKSVSKRLQGALLMDEIFQCIHSQKPYLGIADAPYYDLGMRIAEAAARNYIEINRLNGNADEVQKLQIIHQRYREEITL